MEIEFAVASDNNYAMNPQTEKRAGARVMRMNHRGCTHFLVISSPLDVQIDFSDPNFQSRLLEMSGNLLNAQDVPLSGQENVTVTLLSYMEFRKANEYIKLPDKAANYSVCGCHLLRDNTKMRVFVPTSGMRYRVTVAVELHYKMKPYVKVTKKFWREEKERTAFYEVFFEQKVALDEGSIVYTIGQMPYKFPVTEQMLGKTVLIRTNGEIPQFMSTTPGVVLCNE